MSDATSWVTPITTTPSGGGCSDGAGNQVVILRAAGLREFGTWNCVLLLERL